jgi:membrane-associated phospholipid phosphatase
MDTQTTPHIPKETPIMGGALIFYFCFLVWFAANSFIFLHWSQTACFLRINHLRSFPADLLFTGLTYLGNGFTIVFIGIILIVRNKRSIGGALIFSYAISGIVTLVAKRYFNIPRPEAYFRNHSLVETASWVKLYYKHSFPSGHSASIFAAAITISLFLPRKRLAAVICFLIACLTAYSRVYLGEHFLEDVWAGSFIGVSCGTCCFLLQQYAYKAVKKRKVSGFKATATGKTKMPPPG